MHILQINFKEIQMNTTFTLSQVKQKVQMLKGHNIAMQVNKGRNKIVSLTAEIIQVYPSMFIISPTCKVDLDRKSFSYSDVLCGDIKFLNN